MRGRRPLHPIADLVPQALHGLGVPSAKLTAAIEDAWTQAADPAWRGQVRLERLQAGVLDVAVSSAPLRDELTHFHAVRLLSVLRAALPATPLVQIRFLMRGPQGVR